MKKKIICSLVVFFCIHVAFAQNYSYTSDSKRKGIEVFGESVELKIEPEKISLPGAEREAVGAIVGAIAGPVIDVVVTLAKNAAEKKAKQYIAEYSCANSSEAFYESREKANLPKLTIQRWIRIKDSKSNTIAKEQAVLIVLVPELSKDKLAFRYKLGQIKLDYSKAKTKKDYDFIDFKLDVKFKALTVIGDKYEVAELRAFTMNITSIKPGADYDVSEVAKSSWLPLLQAPSPNVEIPGKIDTTKTFKKYEKAIGNKSTENYTETLKEAISSTKTILQPSGEYSKSGTYEFEVAITESNPYKIKAENKQQFIEKTSEPGTELLKAIAGIFFPAERKQDADTEKKDDENKDAK